MINQAIMKKVQDFGFKIHRSRKEIERSEYNFSKLEDANDLSEDDLFADEDSFDFMSEEYCKDEDPKFYIEGNVAGKKEVHKELAISDLLPTLKKMVAKELDYRHFQFGNFVSDDKDKSLQLQDRTTHIIISSKGKLTDNKDLNDLVKFMNDEEVNNPNFDEAKSEIQSLNTDPERRRAMLAQERRDILKKSEGKAEGREEVIKQLIADYRKKGLTDKEILQAIKPIASNFFDDNQIQKLIAKKPILE